MTPAIVLAAFGTSESTAVGALLNVRRRVETAFPESGVSLAFTSNTVRKIWHARGRDEAFRAAHPEIPPELYAAPNVLSALAAVQEEAFRPVLLQSLHVTDGEEFTDLQNLARTLAAYETAKPERKPFPRIAVGAPALGAGDGGEKALARAAEALRPLADAAKAKGAALVLMAHGNRRLEQGVFGKFEKVLRAVYGPQVYIGTVEAPPFAEDVVKAVQADTRETPGKALLAPLMIVAGEHALRDMAGDEADSWKSLFRAAGFDADCFCEGLGSCDSWADIYVESLGRLSAEK